MPVLLPSSPLCRCSFVEMVLQSKCVVLSNLFFCPSMFTHICVIFCVLKQSFKNSLALTILWKFGSSQHITCFEQHCLTQWWTMPRTSGLILLYYVSRNRQYVKSVFVQLSTLFRRLHALSACAIWDTNFPMQGAIWTTRRSRYCPLQ